MTLGTTASWDVRTRWLPAAVLAVVVVAGCGLGSEDGPIARGDAAFAEGDFGEALAEYRLALSRGADDAEIHLRAAHAYAHQGQLSEARERYEDAVARDSTTLDQAVADLTHHARRAASRGDYVAASTAMEAVLDLQPGVSVGELALPLARHYAQSGRYARAVPFFEQALAEARQDDGQADAELLHDMAMVHEELGDCERAVLLFEALREKGNATQREEADWYIGRCSYDLGISALQRGATERAVEHLTEVVGIGEPRHLLADAYFQLGRALSLEGACDAAVQAFERAQRDELGGSIALVEEARARVDAIRFGDPGDDADPEGC